MAHNDDAAVFADAAKALSTAQRWQAALRAEMSRPALRPDTGAELLALIDSGELERGAAAAGRLRAAVAGGQ